MQKGGKFDSRAERGKGENDTGLQTVGERRGTETEITGENTAVRAY